MLVDAEEALLFEFELFICEFEELAFYVDVVEDVDVGEEETQVSSIKTSFKFVQLRHSFNCILKKIIYFKLHIPAYIV